MYDLIVGDTAHRKLRDAGARMRVHSSGGARIMPPQLWAPAGAMATKQSRPARRPPIPRRNPQPRALVLDVFFRYGSA